MNVDMIARGTPGFTGAELANLVNIAATKVPHEALEPSRPRRGEPR